MSSICLLLSGVALLINGLGLLGRIKVRDSAVFNLLIGGLQLVLAVLISVAAGGDSSSLLDVSSIFLFGITYFYVGLSSLLELGPHGVGWYCGFVEVLAVQPQAVFLRPPAVLILAGPDEQDLTTLHIA